MVRRFVVGLGVVLLMALSVPSTAFADTVDDYTPKTTPELTLAGSTAVAECEADAPWIDYSVTLTDPANVSKSHTAKLYLTDGTNSVEIPLGELQDNHLTGRLLWPGASVDPSGNANGWPGWTTDSNGQSVPTTGNYAWTRGAITAELRVNPEIAVPLSYPPATAACAGPEVHGAPASLPATGVSAAILPIGIAGGAVVLAGVLLLLMRRRAHR